MEHMPVLQHSQAAKLNEQTSTGFEDPSSLHMLRRANAAWERPHMAHVLEIAQRRSDLVEGILLLLCLFLNLLTILICTCSLSVRRTQSC